MIITLIYLLGFLTTTAWIVETAPVITNESIWKRTVDRGGVWLRAVVAGIFWPIWLLLTLARYGIREFLHWWTIKKNADAIVQKAFDEIRTSPEQREEYQALTAD